MVVIHKIVFPYLLCPPSYIPQNQLMHSLRKTLSYDPAKSETFKALQEAELGDSVQEVTAPAQTRVFSPSAQLKVTYLYYNHKLHMNQQVSAR
jgi:hypothetical protein